MWRRRNLLISAVIWTVASASVAQAQVKVGIAGPLSGSSLPAGEQQEIGAQKAFDHLNESGGLLGEELIVTSVDDACEPEQAKAAARQLVREGVIFVVGHVCSHASLAAAKIYEDAGIIMISPASTNPKVTDDGGPNIFRVIGRDDQQGTIAGDFLAKNYSDKNIAILNDGQTYGLGLAEFTKRQLNRRGVKEVIFDRYNPEQVEYETVVNALVDAHIDVLYIGGYQGDIGIILRQAKKKLPNLVLISGDNLATEDFPVIAGEAVDGTYFTFGPDMRRNAEAKAVVQAIRDEEAYEPEGYTLYSYGAVQAWAQAVQMADSFDTDAVIEALKSGEFNTVLGKIGFDENGDATGISSFVWYVFDEEGYKSAE